MQLYSMGSYSELELGFIDVSDGCGRQNMFETRYVGDKFDDVCDLSITARHQYNDSEKV